MLSLCNHWEFTPVWTDEYMMSFGAGEAVRLPHNVKELPLHYIDHNSYQMVCGYRRKLEITDDLLNNRLFLQFDGAAHIATVYVNGKELAHHRCGYTSFRVEITDSVILGENIIAVKLDTTENPMIPPFGFVIDYLTYGGLYREVWLDVRNQSLVSDVYITTPTTESAHIEITAENTEGCSYQIEIRDEEGNILLNKRTYDTVLDLPMRGVRKWRIDDPYR